MATNQGEQRGIRQPACTNRLSSANLLARSVGPPGAPGPTSNTGGYRSSTSPTGGRRYRLAVVAEVRRVHSRRGHPPVTGCHAVPARRDSRPHAEAAESRPGPARAARARVPSRPRMGPPVIGRGATLGEVRAHHVVLRPGRANGAAHGSSAPSRRADNTTRNPGAAPLAIPAGPCRAVNESAPSAPRPGRRSVPPRPQRGRR